LFSQALVKINCAVFGQDQLRGERSRSTALVQDQLRGDGRWVRDWLALLGRLSFWVGVCIRWRGFAGFCCC
jgi:hypothetical protein